MTNKNDREMEFEDIYPDHSEKPAYKRGYKPLELREIEYPNKLAEFLLKNDKKNTKRLLIVIIVFLVLFIALVIASFINDKLNLINKEETVTRPAGQMDEDEDFDEQIFGTVYEVSDAASLDDLLKKWYEITDNIMSQKYVTNVLLIGIDGKDGVKKGGNSDALILVSINRKTEEITLISFMRDSRTYFEIEGRDYWRKVNATFAWGGPDKTVETLERDYKIDIDYYVAVDFTTFPKLIDALGGIEVEVQQYEQEYINRTTTKIKKLPDYGKVKLDGKQALVYSRIRHSDADSDVSRTRRQRAVIEAIIKSAKGASVKQLNKAIDSLLPYLGTDCPKTKILSYGAKALTQGWMDYDMKQITMPDEDTRLGTYINGEALWVVDYPLAAQRVQQALYGKTNIQLDDDRVSALDYLNRSSTEQQTNGQGVRQTYNYYLPPEDPEQTTKRSLWGWWNRTEPATQAQESTTHFWQQQTEPVTEPPYQQPTEPTTRWWNILTTKPAEEPGGQEQPAADF